MITLFMWHRAIMNKWEYKTAWKLTYTTLLMDYVIIIALFYWLNNV